MKKVNFGMAFSKEFAGNDPLSHIVTKLPVYLELLELCRKMGWDSYVFTRLTYMEGGIFKGSWRYDNGKFEVVTQPVKADLVYDRTGGINFPPEDGGKTIWVNRRDFKILAWDKWMGYQSLGKYMPQTLLVENEKELPEVVAKIKTDWIVLKPYNGLKGLGIFIGPKNEAKHFKFDEKYSKYIAQEFVDTSGGIPGVTGGMHDLRVAIVNGKIPWSHFRVPKEGTFLANAAQGGNLTELNPGLIPDNIKEIAMEVSGRFYKNYDNPIYSLDFGVGKDGKPMIFEINDQIGFPKPDMKNKDNFLNGIVINFKGKLATK